MQSTAASSSREEEDDEPMPTRTTVDQEECEQMCAQHLKSLRDFTKRELEAVMGAGLFNESEEVRLLRERHVSYCLGGLRHLSPGFIALDASRPWLSYWMLHSLDLLEGVTPGPDTAHLLRATEATLARCQNAGGGFGGGPQQLSHCAPTYASVLSLLVVGTDSAYDVIDRPALYRWFMSLKTESGGFRMHHDGEVDVRGTYTVLAVASLLHLLTPELAQGVAEYLLACQTYEGGFGGEPGNEAHGGYVFCAVAALLILGRLQDADTQALQEWLCHRQMPLEGGFQGRTNKLVDGCYSFWQGGTAALLEVWQCGKASEAVAWDLGAPIGQRGPVLADHPEHQIIAEEEDEEDEVEGSKAGGRGAATLRRRGSGGVSYDAVSILSCSGPEDGDLSFNQHALQRYVLHCAQALEGGLRDKPGKSRDFYHTCYCLSGLSVAQWGCYFKDGAKPVVYGDMQNLLATTNPVYNIRDDKVERAVAHFSKLPSTHEALMQQQQAGAKP